MQPILGYDHSETLEVYQVHLFYPFPPKIFTSQVMQFVPFKVNIFSSEIDSKSELDLYILIS